MKGYRMLGAAGILLAAVCGLTGCSKKETEGFSPRLDTGEKVVLSTAGFFGNFEALDQVTADFNAYYPNVEFSYEQVGSDTLAEYLETNPGVDILMTSEDAFSKFGNQVMDYCADLSKEDIDLSDLEADMLSESYHDGKLLSIPMGQNLYGIVVNVSLLEKAGLEVPATYEEFLHTLEALKEQGYTPIQGPDSKVYAELTQGMVFDLLLDDDALYEDLLAGKQTVTEKLQPVMDRLDDILQNGYTDPEINQTYPADNYDEAILRFFEGDVPFWVCNTEKVSGMKKRETKSEAFQANPFEYTYIYAPLGENGAYVYREPWYGFAANKNADNYEYAVEFIRFLVTKDEINKMADIKGIPSIAAEKTENTIYQHVLQPEKTELEYVNEGKITPEMIKNWYTCTNAYATGKTATAKEALETFTGLCSGQIVE